MDAEAARASSTLCARSRSSTATRRCSPTPTGSPRPRPPSARSSPSSHYRLDRIADRIDAIHATGKFNGATGTYAAHVVADPSQDWPTISHEFVTSLGLQWNPLTTQIESHDWQAELYQAMSHANRVLHNLCTDLWAYISMGYFRQIPQPGRHRLIDDAAQDQPDPVRERGGQSRALERAARLARRDAGHQPAPARPHRLIDPAQHRCRVRAFPARAGQHPARARRDRSRPRRGSPPTSTRTGRCSARPSRPSSAPR